MAEGTERNRQFRHMLEIYETLSVRLDAFRNQVALMLELDFEDLPGRSGAAYGKAFAKYYQSMRSAGAFFFPDEEEFEQSFDAACLLAHVLAEAYDCLSCHSRGCPHTV